MKELSKFPYILNSKEFHIFSRDKGGDIQKTLNMMLKQTPLQVLDKFRSKFQINEDQDESKIQLYKERIVSFLAFIKQAIPFMEVRPH